MYVPPDPDSLTKNIQQIPTYVKNECASLVLRTSDATVSNTFLTSHTWRNICLRTLLGDMYDKYDTFMLKPVYIGSANPPAAGAGYTNDDRGLVFNIEGLPFYNHLNSTTGFTKTQTCIFGFLQLRLFIPTSINGGIPLTFGKYKELTDITIFYNRPTKVNNSYQFQTNNPYPDMLFSFQIFGIGKPRKIIS